MCIGSYRLDNQSFITSNDDLRHFTNLAADFWEHNPLCGPKSESKLYYDHRLIGQSVLVQLNARFLLLSDICGFVHMGRPL
jgi:hypothetical protein